MVTTTQHIIVVEDDFSMNQALERLLSAANWQTKSFSSAESLLDSGEAINALCFIFDIRLPGLSGVDLWRQLVKAGINCPVIFITGHEHPAFQEQINREGAAGYFLKPFSGRVLVEAVSNAIRSRAQV